jgi:hypothetical protein
MRMAAQGRTEALVAGMSTYACVTRTFIYDVGVQYSTSQEAANMPWGQRSRGSVAGGWTAAPPARARAEPFPGISAPKTAHPRAEPEPPRTLMHRPWQLVQIPRANRWLFPVA